MESTAVTSVQPAPMTRRARREAEQQAQALRARGARNHPTHPPVAHPPVTHPPVTRPPVPHPQASAPWSAAGNRIAAETRVAFAQPPVPASLITHQTLPVAPMSVPLPAVQVTPLPAAAPGRPSVPTARPPRLPHPSGEIPLLPRPVPATPTAPPAARGTASFDQLVTGAIPRPVRAPSVPAGQRLISRATVIGTLAAATIAAPFAQGLAPSGESPFEVEAPPTGPNVLDLVTQPVERPETSGAVLRAEAMTRPESAASRSFDRSPLPDCDVDAPVEGTNGALADHSLCELWQAGEYLRPDAAMSLSALNEAFRASFGREMCLVASYRDLDTQYELKASRGWYAASPGTSMHGWGLAIDLCSKETGDSEVFSWLWANAPSYGWQNPSWAQLGGSKYEPWHWEFVSGVVEKGEWHG
ncbi:D-alanyl-D-alanine carboxypeptidase family protein [Promicromonospora sp. NPDC050880]|uniref:M15 family metallopeptidase n=1 Tax=Promicromonospora sp. NPDC050880 TaxID=3364406 RepID=UPI0037AD6AF8